MMKGKYAVQKALVVPFVVLITCVSICSICLAEGLIIDHTCTDILQIPQSAIEEAKTNLHIGYGHTSHGRQLTTGMTGLVGFINNGGLGLSLPPNFFAWNNGGAGGALDLHDNFMSGDLGNPDRTTWAARTREYLNSSSNSDVNVIIWSWCGQADTSEENINQYLSLMNQLERDYPDVTFVYMTGHANGTGETGNLHLRNRQIRDYCVANNKFLYDFYDIECYDPDGNYFGDKSVNDDCYYDSDDNGSRDANWAVEWQDSHQQDFDWYDCSSAHSEPLNANRKAYAAWWLWARVAGWNPSPVQHGLTIDKVGEGTVALDPSGDAYDENTQVQLTAQADSGWVFSGWSDDLSGSQNSGTVTMDAEKTVTATFTELQSDHYTIAIDKVGEGTVTLDPPGAAYDENTQVQLTAQADSGWVFSGWSDDLSGSQNPGTVTMDAEKTVTATFTDSGAEDGGNSDSDGSGCFISIAKSNGYSSSLNEKAIFR
jgi:hypothetical protein